MYITHIHIYSSMYTVIYICVHTHTHTLYTYTCLSAYIYYTHFHFFKRLEARALSGCCDPAAGLRALLQGAAQRRIWAHSVADIGISLSSRGSEVLPLPRLAKFHKVESGGRIFGMMTSET